MVRKWVEDTVRILVDKVEFVKVTEMEGDTITIIEINVAKEDIGKIVGKGGHTVDAMRKIVNCLSAKEKRKYLVQVNG